MADEGMYWNQMSNDKLSEINKQLLGVAAILIPLIGSVLALSIPLNEAVKTIIAGSLIFLLASIACGFVDITVGYNFFKEYQEHNSLRARIYHGKLFTQIPSLRSAELEIGELKPLEKSSGNIYLILQGVFISIGLLLIAGAIITLLVLKQK